MAYSSLTKLPPTDSLVAALTALRLGSFSAAASELGITHAAVSRRIAVAEEWAGERRKARSMPEQPPGNDDGGDKEAQCRQRNGVERTQPDADERKGACPERHRCQRGYGGF